MEESASHHETLNANHHEEGEQPMISDVVAALRIFRDSYNEILSDINQLWERLDKDPALGPADDETAQKTSAAGATLKPSEPTNVGPLICDDVLAILKQHMHSIAPEDEKYL
ncbi:hypothetical protein L484_004521 [Morus notabilis]|uniref:Uncharacterized protein n=1 Tax=Morus notabilis TaxID=981085 RepID=W9R5T8_9ROSA|nr:hypothetical protein L484_004521 [Morus notabilis]